MTSRYHHHVDMTSSPADTIVLTCAIEPITSIPADASTVVPARAICAASVLVTRHWRAALIDVLTSRCCDVCHTAGKASHRVLSDKTIADVTAEDDDIAESEAGARPNRRLTIGWKSRIRARVNYRQQTDNLWFRRGKVCGTKSQFKASWLKLIARKSGWRFYANV